MWGYESRNGTMKKEEEIVNLKQRERRQKGESNRRHVI